MSKKPGTKRQDAKGGTKPWGGRFAGSTDPAFA